MLLVRKFNKDLLLAVLDSENFPNEERTAANNIKSRAVCKAAFRTLQELWKAGYEQYPYSSPMVEAIRSISWKEIYENIMSAVEYDNDFMVARGLLIKAVSEMCIEQKADIKRLLSISQMSAFISKEPLYSIKALDDATWIPKDLKGEK